MNPAVVNFINLDQEFTLSGDDLGRFWDLETIGISANHDRSLNGKDSKLLAEFRTSSRVEDRGRVDPLPEKQDTALPNNRLNAEKRLDEKT